MDAAPRRRPNAADEHIDVARRVRQSVGADDLIFDSGSFWRYRDRGLWSRTTDREIQKEIHIVLDHGGFEVKFGKSTVDSVLDLLRTECHRPEHRWNATTEGISTLSGVLEWSLETKVWRLRPHRRQDFLITQIPVHYDPAAKAPRFLIFMEEIFKGDEDFPYKAQCLLEFIGYTLLTTCRYEKFMLLVGSGANGKTVALKIVEALLGPEMVCAVQPSQLDNRFQRAHLAGKLANIVTEIAEGAEIADAQLKAIVSGELTTAEHKHRDPFDFHPVSTCWFATNHMPHSRDFSDALFRRALILQFNNRFSGEQCDPRLIDKLRAELPGILTLAVEAIGLVHAKGTFTEPSSSVAAKRAWQVQCDQAAQYFEERLNLRAGAKVSSSTMYADYREWATQQGIHRFLTQVSLVTRLKTRYQLESHSDGVARYLHGCEFKMAGIPNPDERVPF